MVTGFEIAKGVSVGGDAPLLLIAGPCVLEEETFTLKWAERLKKIVSKYPFGFIFKASYDKANRTTHDTYRGPMLDEGLRLLEKIRTTLGVPVLTDVHESQDCHIAAEVVDMIQIPAFLCRQTPILVAAGATGKPVNIKKGQFIHPEGMRGAAGKVKSGGESRITLTERGTVFGYHDLIVDMRNLEYMRKIGYPVIFDGTHAVQQPGSRGGRTGGNRMDVPGLVRSAVAHGIDGLFLEAHPEPERSPSDGMNMLTPEMLEIVLEQAVRIDDIRRTFKEI